MISRNTLLENRHIRRLYGSEDTVGGLPWLNEVIFIYVSFVILMFTSYLIGPVQSFMASTPLYHIQRWLGLLGAVLLAADLFTNRGLWRGSWCILLYGISLIAAFSSLRYVAYGEVRNNLYPLCWSAVQIGLLYSCAWRFPEAVLRKKLLRLYVLLMTVWMIACLVSLYQFAMQISYTAIPNPLADDQTPFRFGFYDNRLFGVFNPINHAAYVTLMFFFITLYYFRQSRRVGARVLLVFCALVLLSYIILCSSRSSWVALAVGILTSLGLYFRSRRSGGTSRRRALCILVCVLAAILAALFLYRFLLMKLPELASGKLIDLRRTGLEGDASNGRLSIWRDYCSLWREIGLTGLSPGNYMAYIIEHHPELYIVDFIRVNEPAKLAGGVIYHTHNGYLMVFVAAGLIGLALLLAYLTIMAIRCLRHIIRNTTLRDEWLLSLVIVLTGLVSAVFDKGMFLDSSPQSFLFWLFAGFAVRELSARDGEDGKNE